MFLKKYKELLLLIILFTFLLNVFLPDFTEEKILLHILASPAPGMCGPLIGTSLLCKWLQHSHFKILLMKGLV